MKQIYEFIVKHKLKEIDYVDLGLKSGTWWCTKNIGAKTKYDPGDYYAWGDTKTQEKYSASLYVFSPVEQFIFTKYNDTDKLIELEDCDNVAKKRLGNKYDLPTIDQVQELYDNTSFEIDSENHCAIFISKINDKKLIIPLGGWKGVNWQPGSQNVNCIKKYNEAYRFWTKNLVDDDCDYAWSAKLNTRGKPDIFDTSRHLGGNIRPVINK